MILYFSGTGNSAFAAKFIGEAIDDQVLDLFDKIRNNDYSTMESNRPWVIAAPVYCWQLPHIVRDWMKKAEFKGNKDVYFVLTCGGDMGNGEKYLKKLCKQVGLNYKGSAEVIMPENYIALFEAPDKEKAQRIIKGAERSLQKAADMIKAGKRLADVKTGLAGKLNSSIVNMVYYPLIVKDKKFYAEDSCTGCGLCEKKCPLVNITMKGGKPSWNGNCTHCMACISYCPAEAIEYGKASKGKERYICPR